MAENAPQKNASVIFATQSLSDIDGSNIAPAIIESCPTRLLLPNERAIEPQITEIYRRFGLNDRQIEILARATPKRDYYCQSRRGNRLFELGLSEIGLALCAASAKSDQTLIAQIVAEHGRDGFLAAWLRARGVEWAAELIPNLTNLADRPESAAPARLDTHPTGDSSMTYPKFVGASALALALAVPVALSPMLASPAHAQFGFGRIVYDPSNYAQNLLTAARTLEQINNQITSLQNEAQMLINQARNLASLPYSSLQQLQQNVSRTQQLLSQAQNIAFEVGQIDQAFQQQYGNVSLSTTDAQLVADARSRWENTVGGLQDAMRVQAGAVGNIDSNRAEMAALVGQSQGATGALQATQAGNQLLALQSQQLSDLIAVISANGRADALTEAERATAAEQGRIQRERFLTPGSGYQPGNAQMFNNGNN